MPTSSCPPLALSLSLSFYIFLLSPSLSFSVCVFTPFTSHEAPIDITFSVRSEKHRGSTTRVPSLRNNRPRSFYQHCSFSLFLSLPLFHVKKRSISYLRRSSFRQTLIFFALTSVPFLISPSYAFPFPYPFAIPLPVGVQASSFVARGPFSLSHLLSFEARCFDRSPLLLFHPLIYFFSLPSSPSSTRDPSTFDSRIPSSSR